MRRQVVLWAAFALVHAWVAWLGWVLPNQPMGDVSLVYEPWSQRALSGIAIVGVTEPWVYPALALAPMLLAQAPAAVLGSYELGWPVLVTVLDAAAFALLVGRATSVSRRTAAWCWLVYAALLGPIGMYRLDAVTVPLAVAGVLWLAGRPAVAGALFAAGAWIKVWPAALLAAGVVAARRRASAVALVVGAFVCTAVVCAVVAVAGGARHLLGFVTTQQGRGLQIEAPAATPYLWGAMAGREGWSLYYDPQILTFQVAGPGVDVVSGLMNPLLAVAAVAILSLAAVKARRGAAVRGLLPPAALALTLAFIVCNKVGSPQFHAWVIAPLVLWLLWDRRQARPLVALALVCAALTQLVYPIAYWSLLLIEPVGVLAVTARNCCVVVLFAWAVVRLAGVPVTTATRVDRAPQPQ